MARYGVGGHNAIAGAASTNRCLAAIWNPHASRALILLHAEWWQADASPGTSNLGLVRISTQGTPGSTVTPDADNDYRRKVAPATGALLNLGDFSVQPTVQGPYMKRAHVSGPASGAGSGIAWVLSRGLFVPAGTGIAIVTTTSFTFDAGDSSWTFDD